MCEWIIATERVNFIKEKKEDDDEEGEEETCSISLLLCVLDLILWEEVEKTRRFSDKSVRWGKKMSVFNTLCYDNFACVGRSREEKEEPMKSSLYYYVYFYEIKVVKRNVKGIFVRSLGEIIIYKYNCRWATEQF